VPVDYRVFDKDRDGKTKNDHFAEMLLAAYQRGFNPELVCFDSWYASVENLKLVCSLGWHFLTRLKSNRQIRFGAGKLQAVSGAGLCGGNGTRCWLKGFGDIKVFRGACHRRHIGILGDESSDERGGAREICSVGVAD